MNKSLLMLMLMLTVVHASSAYANGQSDLAIFQSQSPARVSDDLARALEKSLIELESARKVNSLQREQLDALEGKIKALEDLVKIERERAESYKAASAERAAANALDDRRIALFEKSLEEFKAEVQRLRDERDAARRSRNRWAVVGVVIGATLGLFAAK